MKIFYTLLFCCLSLSAVFAQGTSINSNGTPPHPSAMLDVDSDSKGMLVPRMTQTARDTINAPAVGLLIFNTSTNCFNFWSGSTWRQSCFDCDFSLPTVGNNGPICEGSTLNLTCSAVPGATYQWTGPNGFSSTSQNPSIPNVTSAGNGLYSVIVTVNGCSSTPLSTVVTVNATPATPTAGVNANICPGDNINLTASPIVGATFAWTGPNGYSSNAQNPTITGASSTDNGTYSVTATVNGCSSNSSSVSVSVASSIDSFYQTLTGDFNSNVDTNVSAANDELTLSEAIDGGTGADGAYVASSNTTLVAGTYNYTSFTINPGVTVTVTGNSPLIIKSQGPVNIQGILDGDGNGHPGGLQAQPGQGTGGGGSPGANSNWGAHGGGGSYGSMGTQGSNGGPGSSAIGGAAGSTYGDPQISVLHMGSGGGGNGWCSPCNGGGMNKGGDGGGAVRISSPVSISVSGTITMDGENGVGNSTYASGASGAGSGGTIHLIAPTINQTGNLTATGGNGGQSSDNSSYNCCGGNGGNGRIRLEFNTLNGFVSSSPSASTGSVTVNPSGSSVTSLISPSNFCQWGTLNFDADVSGSGTSLTVDILDNANNALATGVSNGTDLNTLPAVAAVSAIKLRANLSTSNTANTPILRDWKVKNIKY